jgi:putative phosphoribosyl transferase
VPHPIFVDRRDAGRRLGDLVAERCPDLVGADGVVVLGLARGGVPVAAAVAERLRVPVDAFLVRKVGVPGQPELAAGAVASGGVIVRNDLVIAAGGIEEAQFARAAEHASAVLIERERAIRGDKAPLALAGRTAVVVDDGLATGASARVAIQAIRAAGVVRVVLAVPVAAADSLGSVGTDAVVCLTEPRHFSAVGAYYQDFSQVTDDQVRQCLHA